LLTESGGFIHFRCEATYRAVRHIEFGTPNISIKKLPATRQRAFCAVLFCVIDCAIFTNKAYLNLTGIFKVAFNLFNDFASSEHHLVITNNIGLNHNTNFAACLNCKGLFNTVEGVGDFLQLFKSLNIAFDIFSAGAWSCGRNCIGSLNKTGDNGFSLNIAVMSVNGVDNRLVFFILLGTSTPS